MRKGDWIQTFTGVKFYPLDPRVEEIKLEDIAHSLANQCRYTGHCLQFYSVAQHCVLVARNIVSPWFEVITDENEMSWGLLHDASEAYLVDLPRPIKHHSALGREYRKIERRLMRVISARFGLTPVMPRVIKETDTKMMFTEKRDIMPKGLVWKGNVEPYDFKIYPWSPNVAEHHFLCLADELGIV